jgi:hypothetical protein
MGQVLDRVSPLLSILVTGLNTFIIFQTLKIQQDNLRSQDEQLKIQRCVGAARGDTSAEVLCYR